MRRSSWTPSIVPNDFDQNIYLVVDDFGRQGLSFRRLVWIAQPGVGDR